MAQARGLGLNDGGLAPEVGERWCAADGARLRDDGWCPRAKTYPVVFERNGELAQLACPFVCSLCRQRLSWQGGCHRCHGTTTPEDYGSWRIEGQRYESDGAGHYALTDAGPAKMMSEAELGQVAGALKDLIARFKIGPVRVSPAEMAAEAVRMGYREEIPATEGSRD